MSVVRLVVNGRRFSAWSRVSVTRSMRALCGTFELTATDRPVDDAPPIEPWDRCSVLIDDEVVIDGYIGPRSVSVTATSRDITYRGRDRAADVYDSSALPSSWTRRGLTLLQFARELCAPHGVGVSVAPGVTLPTPPAKFTINPGDTVFQALSRECEAAGVLLVSDGRGGLVFTRAGTARAVPLVLGQNIKEISGEDNPDVRYHRHVVLGQSATSDTVGSGAARIRGEAIDADVPRENRVSVLLPSGPKRAPDARRYAEWSLQRSIGESLQRTALVVGWRQRPGDDRAPIWAPNQVTPVDAPAAFVERDMLISDVTYTLDRSGGEVAAMTLVPPETFAAEPS